MLDLQRAGRAVGKRKTWLHLSAEVDSIEVHKMLDGIEAAYKPEGLTMWMEMAASPIMAKGITEYFAADGGGGLTGGWAPLQESTILIKNALGVSDPEGINTRTDAMFEALITDHEINTTALGSEMQIPGDMDGSLREKLATAAHGRLQTAGDMMPGAYTPPRPVAVITGIEQAMLMMSLQLHIMNAAAMGGTITGRGFYKASM